MRVDDLLFEGRGVAAFDGGINIVVMDFHTVTVRTYDLYVGVCIGRFLFSEYVHTGTSERRIRCESCR